MAKYCYDCYKKILKSEKDKHELIISKYWVWCEGCYELKHIVICENMFFGFLRDLFFNH